jgi:hypothetical protein
MSLFEVLIDSRLKVVNVEGLKQFPVKRWEVVTTPEDKKSKPDSMLLRVCKLDV